MPRLVIEDYRTVEPAVVVIQQLCMVMCQKEKDTQDGQRSNENDESVANSFTDLTLSTVD